MNSEINKIKKLCEFIQQKRRWIIIITIALPFLILFYLKITAHLLPGNIFVITDRVEKWFSNILSYIGIVISAVLGIYTVHLTLVLDNINNKNHHHDNKLSVINDMPKTVCTEVGLYRTGDSHFYNNYLCRFAKKKEYIMVLCMSPAFPPYFKVTLKNIKIELMHTQSNNIITEQADLSEKDYTLERNQYFYAIINMPEQLDSALSQAYTRNNIPSPATPGNMYMEEIWIECNCENVLMDREENDANGNEDDLSFLIHLSIKNTGDNTDDLCGMEFEVLNLQFERISEIKNNTRGHYNE